MWFGRQTWNHLLGHFASCWFFFTQIEHEHFFLDCVSFPIVGSALDLSLFVKLIEELRVFVSEETGVVKVHKVAF